MNWRRDITDSTHERMHVDVRFELEDRAEFSLIEQQRACDNWVTTFNHVRPHEALGQRLPARCIDQATAPAIDRRRWLSRRMPLWSRLTAMAGSSTRVGVSTEHGTHRANRWP